jgi:formylglycine-generating enzyme required for sulfatase activity
VKALLIQLRSWKSSVKVMLLTACVYSCAPAADRDIIVQDQIEFIQVPAGAFMMGASDFDRAELTSQKHWSRFEEYERPYHSVTLSKPFLLSRCEITQGQWKAVMGKNPSAFKGDDLPVESVSWDDVQQFITKLEEKSKTRYRLPTEAEWEYCCRAGSTNSFGLDRLDGIVSPRNIACQAWFRANSDNRTHPVGQKHPNAWGFYDMQGNVWEWCEDWFAADFYDKSPTLDPVNRETSPERIIRGGSWFLDWSNIRASVRSGNPPGSRTQYIGFRLACDLGPE